MGHVPPPIDDGSAAAKQAFFCWVQARQREHALAVVAITAGVIAVVKLLTVIL